MKFSLLILTVTIIINSCTKKNISIDNKDSNISETSTIKDDFKYSTIIRISDDSNKHYVDLSVKSNNQNDFNRNIDNLNNTKLILLYSVNINNAYSIKNKSSESMLNLNEPSTIIEFKNINKGNAQAIKLTSKNNLSEQNQKTSTIYYGTHVIITPPCQYYYVVNLGFRIRVNDSYFNGSSWTPFQSVFINQYQSYFFSGTGYLQRLAQIYTPDRYFYRYDFVIVF